MNHRRIISAVTALAVVLGCTANAAMAADVNDMPFEMTGTASVYDEYLEWSQLDSRWGDTPMGNSNVRNVGCLITSLAIMAMHSGSIDSTALENMDISDIEQFNPGVLADAYTKYDGFTAGGAIALWGTINSIIPNIQFGWDTYFNDVSFDGAANELRQLMNDGWHIIARVNNGGFHWVYIESVDEYGNIRMCDPALDTHDLYSAYPYGLQGEYWALKGTDPPEKSFGSNAVYDGSLTLEIVDLPNKTVYQQGEWLDLTGGTFVLSGVDPKNGWWADDISPMTAGKISVGANDFDPYTAGVYDVTLSAWTEYAEAQAVFQVTVVEPEITEPPAETIVPAETTAVTAPAETAAAVTTVTELPETDETTAETSAETTIETTAEAVETTAVPETSADETAGIVSGTETSETEAVGEYFLSSNASAEVTSEIGGGTTVAVLRGGNVVDIAECVDGYGLVETDKFTGWVELGLLTRLDGCIHLNGDINNDGNVDKYDLLLINSYIERINRLPDGISTFTAAQIDAADINCDGIVDVKDIMVYLEII